MDTLKNRVRVLRAEKDISQETLAKAIGVSRQTIVAIEGEDYAPSVILGIKIAKYFEKTFEEVFTLESNETKKR